MADGGIYEYGPISGTASGSTATPTVVSNGPHDFDCARADGGNVQLKVTFYQTQPALALVQRGNETRPAFQVPSGSGAKYAGQEVTFWEKGGEARVTWAGVDFRCKYRKLRTSCTQQMAVAVSLDRLQSESCMLDWSKSQHRNGADHVQARAIAAGRQSSHHPLLLCGGAEGEDWV
jgi:membrane-bound inhibitor of C-type lysozyme